MYEERENELRGTFETYRAEGDALYKNREFRKAIESYDTALGLRPDDKNCLVARSKCHLQLGDTDRALKDAEASLKQQSTFHKGLYQKAEALYKKGEFEMALVYYHRGHRVRPELHDFRLGIQKAQEAIDNSVGSPEKVHLTMEGNLSYFEQLKKPTKTTARGKAYQQKRRSCEVVNTIQTLGCDKTVKQLLGELYGDWVYLEELLRETDPRSSTGENIHSLVCDGLRYLDTRTEFWRQQKPMYARHNEKRSKSSLSGKCDKSDPERFVFTEFEKIQEELAKGDYPSGLKRATRCLKTVTSFPSSMIRNKEELMAVTHRYMGEAHLRMENFDKALRHFELDLKTKSTPNSQLVGLENMGRVYARKGNYKKAMEAWSQRLLLCHDALTRAWLNHEIGRCHMELGDASKASECAQAAIEAAVEAKDLGWELNATVLRAQADVKLSDLQTAVEVFERALELAVLTGDDNATSAVQRAINDVNARIAEAVKSDREAGSVE